jgi:YegS/Rv2252/BmrU family lipid kinase
VPSPFGELTVIVNPHAGRRRVARQLPELEATLRARDLPYRLLRTEGPGDAARFAREALEGGSRFLVAVGGDGTVHEVVNGMMAEDRPVVEEAVLGVVAAGSGCDFVRTFGLPGDATRACFHLTGDNTYPFDVGKVTYSDAAGERHVCYFANVAEAGLGAAVAARAGKLPPRLGEAKYLFAFWLVLPRYRIAQVLVRADGNVYEGPGLMVILGNCQYYGGGMRVSPHSYPGDGALDVLIYKGPKSDSVTLIPKVYRGTHIPHPHIDELRVEHQLYVEADRPLPVEADGEVLGFTPATFEVIPGALLIKV